MYSQGVQLFFKGVNHYQKNRCNLCDPTKFDRTYLNGRKIYYAAQRNEQGTARRI